MVAAPGDEAPRSLPEAANAPVDASATAARIGRYSLLRKIGSGGMGEVFAAFDEQLDRKVAVKILRADEGGSEWNARLLREAQAMARLSHPNVVAIHEVGEAGDRMFIAMEFVAGVTLDAWLAARGRSWREIVAVFIAAARGLHAAHAAGIVHRDFKPSNVMVGDDGRVRVLDFGIAAPQRGAEEAEAEEVSPAPPTERASLTASASAFGWTLTDDGALLGTPRFMSPEQLGGRTVSPASDQFNFCVALYESLYGAHPFVDDPFALTELRARIVAGELREPPTSTRVRGVPGWIFAVLRRGLRPRAEERFASMSEVIAALERDPARLRRRLLAPIALAAVAGAVGFGVSAAVQRDANPCEGGQAVMERLWNPGRRAELGAAFRATGLTFGAAVEQSVGRELDAYTAAWAAMHRDACVAHRDGEHSGALLDTRMACLDRRRDALEGALGLLIAADDDVVEGALRLVDELPRIAHCGDLVSLAAAVPLPEDEAAAREVEALRRRLDAASALAAVGREAESATVVDEILDRGRALDFRPLLAEALLARGRLLTDFGAPLDQVLPALDEAVLTAIGGDLPAVSAEALARRAYVVGVQAGRPLEALFDAALARELLGRAGDPGPIPGLLANNLGAVHVAAGDREQALSRFEEALAIFEGAADERPLELSFTLANVAMQLDEGERRDALFARMTAIRRENLGEGHALTTHGLILWGLYTVDPRLAAERIASACAAIDALPGDERPLRRQCRFYLAHAHAEAGDLEAAAAELAGGLAIAVPELDERPEGLAALAVPRGRAALLAGADAAAIGELRRALEVVGEGPPEAWWHRLDVAEIELTLALHLEATGAHADALVILDRVIPAFETLAAEHREVALQQHLAEARLSRARARILAEGRGARAAAEADAGRAESWYRDAGAGYEWRLAAIDRWRDGVDSAASSR